LRESNLIKIKQFFEITVLGKYLTGVEAAVVRRTNSSRAINSKIFDFQVYKDLNK
jgi:hypothetical protein